MNGKNIGDIGEAVVLTEFLKYGIEVFLPYGENTKIDMIAKFNNKLNKIQVKTTGKYSGNGVYKVELRNTSLRADSAVTAFYNDDDVDYFAIYCLQRPYPILVPFCNMRSMTIRFKETLNGNFENVNYESDYTFDKILNTKSITQMVNEEQKEKSLSAPRCINCGQIVSYGAVLCKQCSVKEKKNSYGTSAKLHITRDELKSKIRAQSFLSIGAEYHVSDNAIRQWCDVYNLPRKKTEIKSYSDEEWEKL